MSTTSIGERSTNALAWGVGGAVGKVLVQLLIQITLARLLDPVAFGQYAAVLTVIGFGYILAEGGFGSALIQKKDITSADVSLALGWSAVLGTITALVIVGSSSLLAMQFGDSALALVFAICAAFIPFLIVANISNSLLRRDLHMKGIQIIQFVAYAVFFGGVAIPCAINGMGVWSLVAGFAAQTLFSLIATYSISGHTLRPRLKGDSALINFGTKSLATDLANWCMENIDRILIGKFWGLHSLGLYSVAFNLSRAPTGLLVSATQSVVFAGTARLQDNASGVRKVVLTSLSAMALATIPLFTLVAFEAEAVLKAVYGVKWIAAAPYMSALAISIPWISIGAILAAILRGRGNVGIQLRIQIIAATVLITGFMVFRNTPLAVAIWIVPFSYFCRFLLLAIALLIQLQLSAKDMLIAFRGAFSLALAGVSAAALSHGIPHAPTMVSVVLPLVAGLLSMGLLLLLRFYWCVGAPLATLLLARMSAGRIGAVIVRLAGPVPR